MAAVSPDAPRIKITSGFQETEIPLQNVSVIHCVAHKKMTFHFQADRTVISFDRTDAYHDGLNQLRVQVRPHLKNWHSLSDGCVVLYVNLLKIKKIASDKKILVLKREDADAADLRIELPNMSIQEVEKSALEMGVGRTALLLTQHLLALTAQEPLEESSALSSDESLEELNAKRTRSGKEY